MSAFIRTNSSLITLSPLEVPTFSVAKEVGHHAVIVDRSGSMYGDIHSVREVIKQVFAVESVMAGETLTSLYSFSSHGDVTRHWTGVKADDVVQVSGPYMKQIDSIRSTCYTGISQAFEMALKDVDKNVTTGITLMTDGYANDPSAHKENEAIMAFIAKVKQEYPRVFVNVIGYRDWCDWVLMGRIANELSGKCIKAKSVKDVYAAMRDTQELVSGGTRPVLEFTDNSNAMLMVVNKTTGQVNAGSNLLRVSGVGADSELVAYKVEFKAPDASAPKGSKSLKPEDGWLMGALALSFYNTNSLRRAKEVLMASGNKTLWEEYATAMSPSSLGEMATALLGWVKQGTNDGFTMGKNVKPSANLFDFGELVNKLPRRSLGLNLTELFTGYTRRSIKKLMGTRLPDGTVLNPRAEGDGVGRCYVKSIDFNKSDASVQVTTIRDLKVRKFGSHEVVDEVKFISLSDIKEFRSYTVLSSGEANVKDIPFEVYNKAAYDAISAFVKKPAPFTPGMTLKVPMKQFSLESDNIPTPEEMLKAATDFFTQSIRQRLAKAMYSKEAGSPMSAEQLAALSELHITPGMNFSPPTTNHYTDIKEAASQGEIDAFTRYNVYVGLTTLLTTEDLYSGNEFLKKAYEVKNSSGEVDKKPTLLGYQAGDTYTPKPQKKTDMAFDIAKQVFESFFSKSGERMSNAAIGAIMNESEEAAEEALTVFKKLSLEVGCTGLLPLDLEAQAKRYNAEEFTKATGIKLPKAQTEGMFYVFPNNLVVSIIPTTEWFTTAIGLEACKHVTYVDSVPNTNVA